MTNDTRPYQQDASMALKHEIVKNDQRVHRDTNFSRAQADFSLAQQGRHAQAINLTGRYDGENRIPRQPATSPSNQMAMVPDEPPTGYPIHETPIVGEPHEIAASLANEQKGTSEVRCCDGHSQSQRAQRIRSRKIQEDAGRRRRDAGRAGAQAAT
jgi:hypothetical protein